MHWKNYESYFVINNNHLTDLNKLLENAYSNNKVILAAKQHQKNDLLENVKFKCLDESRKHILIKLKDELNPCGTVTIYKDLNNKLPIEACLKISLAKIRDKNISMCEVGRLALFHEHRQNPDSILILFCEIIKHCFTNGIKLLVTQAFSFNHHNFYRLGFRYFKGLENGCYDLEFNTNCYPMYIPILDIYRMFKNNVFDNKNIDIYVDKSSELEYELHEEIHNIDVI